jgi:hypothetical protein
MKQTTISYMPEHNDIVEKNNRTLVKNVRCMLQHMKLDHRF